MQRRKKWEVEFWPGKIVQVFADDEDDAICWALHERAYPGGLESTGHGMRAMIWVRPVKVEGEEE